LGASDHSDGGLDCVADPHTDELPSAGSMSRQRYVVPAARLDCCDHRVEGQLYESGRGCMAGPLTGALPTPRARHCGAVGPSSPSWALVTTA
jgi:hypothetical protein